MYRANKPYIEDMKEEVKDSLIGIGYGLTIALLAVFGVISGKTAVIIGLGTIVFSFVLIFFSIVTEIMKEK